MERQGAAGHFKVHSLIDKVYSRTNLRLAWQKVRANRGAGGVDAVSLDDFAERAEEELERLHCELRDGNYRPKPVRRVHIPKRGKPQEKRPLGIPTIRDRVVQQALKNRLEPIFEPEFNDCSFGYRPGRSPHDAMRKVWGELMKGYEWIVDADLRDYFGSVDHERAIDLVAERVSDGRVLALVRQMLQAGYQEHGKKHPTDRGTPQGGVISPLLSNIYLTPFDDEMTRKGYCLTRFADDCLILCRSRAEAQKALKDAQEALQDLGLTLHPEKTRISHISWGFEFLGYKGKRGKGYRLPRGRRKKKGNRLDIYAVPTEKSLARFKDEIRRRTRRRIPLSIRQLIEALNPVIRGWGTYYRKAHVRKLFNRLNRWIVRRIWSHQCRRWRNIGWRRYPEQFLYGECRLVNLLTLIPDLK